MNGVCVYAIPCVTMSELRPPHFLSLMPCTPHDCTTRQIIISTALVNLSRALNRTDPAGCTALMHACSPSPTDYEEDDEGTAVRSADCLIDICRRACNTWIHMRTYIHKCRSQYRHVLVDKYTDTCRHISRPALIRMDAHLHF